MVYPIQMLREFARYLPVQRGPRRSQRLGQAIVQVVAAGLRRLRSLGTPNGEEPNEGVRPVKDVDRHNPNPWRK